MRRKFAGKCSLIAAACAVFVSAFAATEAGGSLNVPAGELVAALKTLADQVELNLVYQPEQLKDIKTQGLKGNYSGREAVEMLLKGTGLRVYVTEKGAMVVAPALAGKDALQAGAGMLRVVQKGGTQGTETRSASTAQESHTQVMEKVNGSSEQTADSSENKIQEIVVTAQKREERLQDVPVPVTAISADKLLNSNQLRLQDYYASVPGLSFSPGLFGESRIAIRGVTTDPYSNPTVGITVDDAPYGSSTGQGGAYAAPEIDPSDLARIELLRGPQGTLYGASSIGGLLKFVTVDPSTDRMSGSVQAGTSIVESGDKLGYSVRGGINVPLSETWAVRASGFTRRDPGYIDDPTQGIDDVNSGYAEGGRFSVLWRPSDDFSLKFGAFLQNSKTHGSSLVHVQPGLGDLEQSTPRGTGWSSSDVESYTANLLARLGRVELTAISGYSLNSHSGVLDFTFALGGLAQALYGVAGSSLPDHAETEKFSQEIRLSIPLGDRVEWLLGGFYTDEKSVHEQEILAVDSATGARAHSWWQASLPTEYEEYAAFTNLTFELTDRFDVQLGGRQSQIKQTLTQDTVADPIFGGDSVRHENSKDNPFTYLVTPRFKVSPNLMAYARFASGYRAGGPNVNSVVGGVPSQFDPDKTQNYEIGAKGNIFNHALAFDASVYYIDWKDIQLSAYQGGFFYYLNAGGAKSQGLELSVEATPLPGLTLAAWSVWNEAELTEDFPPAAGPQTAGDRLPYSSRWSGHFSVDHEFSLKHGVIGFVGGAVSHVGERASGIGSLASANYPAYTKTDVRVGVRYDSWTVNTFVTNVGDKRGVLGVVGLPTYFNYIQPRTIGLSLSKTF